MKYVFIAVFMVFTISCTFAQSNLNIVGTVKNESGIPLDAASVFLSGTTQSTKTNSKGEFSFFNIKSGSYVLVVSMVGFTPVNETIAVSDQLLKRSVVLKERRIQLNEVQVGNKGDVQRSAHFKTFFDNFIGISNNAKDCKIINADIIEYTTNRSILGATSPDFLIIENKNLGYRIKYLLSDFTFNGENGITNFTGDCIFEQLTGNEKQEVKWKKNRLKAYNGSFMHYLRSIYNNVDSAEGFETHIVKGDGEPDSNRVDMSKYLIKMDNNLAELKFKPKLLITYLKPAMSTNKKIQRGTSQLARTNVKAVPKHLPATYLNLYAGRTIIDSRGSFENYQSFFINGVWGAMRLGDQLPFEYLP
ncbi:carboxypeptidase-like regulatory domain-containing protein [Pedobacter sp. PWIIR3]